jgi:hypothetical protein
MPESDRAEIGRRRNELSCPETIGEISHIPRGNRDRAATFGGFLDPLRGVIDSATSLIALVNASSPDAVTKFGCSEIGRSGSSTSAAVSALSSRVKATLIVSTFPSQGDCDAARGEPQSNPFTLKAPPEERCSAPRWLFRSRPGLDRKRRS